MKCTPLPLEGLLLFEPRRFADERGWFAELWQAERYRAAGVAEAFVQDNLSSSRRGVVRGLHYQQPPRAQGKLVSVLRGEVYDVVVDLRRASATFGRWIGRRLSAENGHQLYAPPGFAHGFQALSAEAVFHYKCTDYYDAAAEAGIRWDDPALGIDWPLPEEARVSEKDAALPLLAGVPPERLF